jgi:hypothetical protein
LQMLEQSCIVTFMKQKHWHQLLSVWWVVDGHVAWLARRQCQAEQDSCPSPT